MTTNAELRANKAQIRCYGESVTVVETAATFSAIVNISDASGNIGNIDVDYEKPHLLTLSESVTGLGRGQVLTVRGETYAVAKEPRTDGFGFLRIDLAEKQTQTGILFE